MVDEDVLAGVDVDTVAVAAGGADGEVLDGDVAAERGVKGPHEVVAGGEVFEAEVAAFDGFDEGGMAEGAVGAGAAAEGVCADDFAGADDADVVGVDGVDEGGVAGDPAALPADLGDGVVVHVGGAGEGGVGGEAEEGAGAELDGPGEVVAGGDQDFAAAEDGAAVDRALDGGCVFGGTVAGGSVIADVEAQVCGFGRSLGIGLGFGWWFGQ